MAFGGASGGMYHERGSWPVLLLLLVAVLLPVTTVLWFMNEAMNSQRIVARQRLMDAYRSQLVLLRDRVDAYWEKRSADLEAQTADLPAAAAFAVCLRAGLADSAILFERDGALAYPSAPPAPQADPTRSRPEWIRARGLENDLPLAAKAYSEIAAATDDATLAARALQAQARCLLQSGHKDLAVDVAVTGFRAPRFASARDLQGRLIAADVELMALGFIRPADPRAPALARRLRARLLDYDNPALASGQRLFLMEEMRGLKLAPEYKEFPAREAERLAARFLEAEQKPAPAPMLRPGALPDIWKLSSTRHRVLALYRTETLTSQVGKFLAAQPLPAGVRVAVLPPGAAPPSEPLAQSLAAGERLPGWQLTLSLTDQQSLNQAAEKQRGVYLWIGFLVIAGTAGAALLIGRSIRRQARLARLKTDLVTTVSHELKTPLTSMRLLVDTLLDDPSSDPRKIREYLEMVARENARLSHLIDNFLTFSRMERNKHRFEFRQTEPAEIVRDAVEAVRERFSAPECRLDVQLDEPLPALRADEGALVTVLVNLLDNAYKFTPAAKHVLLRAFARNGDVLFEVQDNGIGLSPRESKKIFRRFYQVDQRLSRSGGGCGLGLSIVDFIVKAHCGAIQVKSQPGKGCTFTVALPTHQSS